MSANGLPVEGGCLCGQVRFRVSAPAMLTLACHCRGCQQLTSSAFSLSVAIPTDAFAVIAGEPAIGGLHRADVEQYYCPSCKTWLFTRPAQAPFVNVRSTLLDDDRWCTPFVDIYTSEKLDWVATPAVHSFLEFPPIEAWRGLIQHYMAQSAAT